MTLTQHFIPSEQTDKQLLTKLTFAFIGSLLLTLSAKLSVPFYPVPQTMQTFVVIGLGLSMGWRLGALTVLLYLSQGALGLPVFNGTPEKGIGLAYMYGPTGGYLLGFVLAAGLAGLLAERTWDRTIAGALLAALLASAIIYVPGLIWLGSVVGWDKPVLEFGLYPFVFGDIAKAVLAALTFPAIWTVLKNRGLV